MTLKEKAIELVDEFEPYVIRYGQDDVVGWLSEETPIFEYQKQCALIVINKMFEEISKWAGGDFVEWEKERWKYLQEFKEEIEKL